MRLFPPFGLVLVSAVLTSSLATSHGGVYRGPGSGIPAGGAATPAATGTPSSAAQGEVSDWRTWWSFNRDPFLNLRAAIHDPGVTTGGDDYNVGQGERPGTRASLRPSTEDIEELVLPALAKALEIKRSDDVRSGAMLALAKIGRGPRGKSLDQLMRPLLTDPSQEIAETAAIALGVAAEPSSAPLLGQLLGDTADARRLVGKVEVPYRTRAFAAYGLGLIGARTQNEDVRRFIVHHLVRALDDRSLTATRDIHVACLISLGQVQIASSPPKPEAASDAKEPDGDNVRPDPPSSSREALVGYLLSLLEDRTRHELVRAHAPVAIARHLEGLAPDLVTDATRRIGALLKRGSGAHTALQQGALSALARLGDNDNDELDRWIRGRLREAHTHGDRTVRHMALVSLARVAARQGDGTEPEAGLVEVRSMLLKKLAGSVTVERPWAALGLGVLERTRQDQRLPSSPDVAQAIRASIGTRESPIEQGAYMLAAGLVRDLDARETLLAHAKDISDDETRGHACVALGLMGAREAVPTLREIVQDSRYRPSVLRDAAVALGLLGDRQTVPLLIDMLEQARGLAATAAITSALGFIGDQRAVRPLVEMVVDEEQNDRTRAFAAVALGLVCDKEPLPWNSKLAVDVTFWTPPATLFDPGGGKGVLDLL